MLRTLVICLERGMLLNHFIYKELQELTQMYIVCKNGLRLILHKIRIRKLFKKFFNFGF